ncbi:MAG: hypothetical protein JZU65_07360, partial [Chlorobium sp.]|nr:hypothetical protein [Chlorobium sp.]
FLGQVNNLNHCLKFGVHYTVIHYNSDELKIERQLWNIRTPDFERCRILLVVSEGGRSALESAQHELWKHFDESHVTFVLYARNQELELCRNQQYAIKILQAFYCMGLKEADAVYREDIQSYPEELHSLFISQSTAYQLLYSFSVLCQGYLVVLCGPDGNNDDGFSLEVNDSTEEIRTAIKEMKWGEVLRCNCVAQSLDPRLTASGPAGRNQMRKEVSGSSYWNMFDAKHKQQLLQTLERMFKRVDGNVAFNNSKAAELLSALPEVSQIENDPLLVAQAFLELQSLLRG